LKKEEDMKNNLELQIELLSNKIERLEIQREFYQKILSKSERKTTSE
jgi:hypothetical protein